MKKHTKKLLSILLCCVMLLGLLPLAAMAADAYTFQFTLVKEIVGNTSGKVNTYTFSTTDFAAYGMTATPLSVTTGTTREFNVQCTVPSSAVTSRTWFTEFDNIYSAEVYLTETTPAIEGCDHGNELYVLIFTVNTATGATSVEILESGQTRVEKATFTSTFTETPRTFTVPVELKVNKTGSADPGKRDFAFDLVDAGDGTPADCGITIMSNPKITTNGEGTFSGTLTGRIADTAKFRQKAGNDNACRFSVARTDKESDFPGWTFESPKSYGVQIVLTSNGSVDVTISLSGDAYLNVAHFTNSYEMEKAELNKVDHFAFLSGYPNGSFRPNQNMTRAEVTTMFARLLTEQMVPGMSYANTFSDVPAGKWYTNYIGYMQRFRIISGYPDGTFRPNAPITRAEFASIACRFEELTEGSAIFSDVPSTHWAARYINFAATRGWVTGYEDGTFRPNRNITRGEVASVTCRLLERSADKDYVLSHYNSLPRTFNDVPQGNWVFWYVMEAANGHNYIKSGTGETWLSTYE